MDHDYTGLATDERNRSEVLHGIERELWIQRRAYGIGLGCQQEGIPIGLCLGHCLAANGRPGARPVLHDHALTKPLRHLLRDQSHRTVDSAAGRERDDDSYGMRRIVLGMRHRADDQRKCERGTSR